jgi:hypothetical protein
MLANKTFKLITMHFNGEWESTMLDKVGVSYMVTTISVRPLLLGY